MLVLVLVLMGQVEALLGPIDVLVNNAGVAVECPSLKHTKRDWEKVRGRGQGMGGEGGEHTRREKVAVFNYNGGPSSVQVE